MSVVRQALQFIQEDLNETGNVSSVKQRKTKNAMKLISTKRKGIWKELRRLQKQEQSKVKSKFERPDFKSSVEKYREEKIASTQSNKSLKNISEIKPTKNAEKVLAHIYHKKCKNNDAKEEEKTTVFTDRDFDKFEKEYDFL